MSKKEKNKKSKKKLKQKKSYVKLYFIIAVLTVIVILQNYQNVVDSISNLRNKVDDTYETATANKLDATSVMKEIRKGRDSQHSMNSIYRSLTSLEKIPNYKDEVIPNNYKYFFKEFIKLKSDRDDSIKVNLDDNILFSTLNTKTYTSSINFEKNQTYFEHKKRIDEISTDKIVITGTYSTPEELPTGLALDEGNVISPFIFDWDGFLIVYGNGIMDIQHRNNLNIGGRKFNLSKGFDELQELISFCRIRNISLIQSHLILNNGDNISNPKNNKKFRRRIVFTDSSGNLSVYDSFENQVTLYEASEIIKKKYNAFNAINLDMGTYNLGLIKSGNNIRDISNIGKSTKLTNVIEIEKTETNNR